MDGFTCFVIKARTPGNRWNKSEPRDTALLVEIHSAFAFTKWLFQRYCGFILQPGFHHELVLSCSMISRWSTPRWIWRVTCVVLVVSWPFRKLLTALSWLYSPIKLDIKWWDIECFVTTPIQIGSYDFELRLLWRTPSIQLHQCPHFIWVTFNVPFHLAWLHPLSDEPISWT